MTTFTDFKNDFYSRVPDLSLFDCGEVNLLKVVLDGLKVNYVSKGKVRSYLFYPYALYTFFVWAQAKRSGKQNISSKTKNADKFANKKYLISDIGRSIADGAGQSRSVYFDTITNTIGVENLVSVADKNVPFFTDINVNELKTDYLYLPLNNEELRFRQQIIDTFNRIKRASVFTPIELENIQYAFHNFFHQYKVWNRFLNTLPDIKTCFFVCHYHKEGQILALKKHKIDCIELQHGLIARQDIFYVFPSVVKPIKEKALFADKIYVFGNYWKQVLLGGCEYQTGQIDTIGYYMYDDFSKYSEERMILKKKLENQKLILITTQTFLHDYFIDFAVQLSNEVQANHHGFTIIVKPHPAENIELYKKAFNDLKNIEVMQLPLPILFEKAFFHISIYSTTLYDALRYNVPNFVFKAKGCEDYVDEILQSGIAVQVEHPSEIFKDIEKTEVSKISVEDFYETYNETILIKN